MKKNIIFNISTVAIAVSLGVLFYNQQSNEKINNNINNLSSKLNRTLVAIDKQMVLSLNNGSESDFNSLNQEFGKLNIDNSEFKKFGDYINRDFSNVDVSFLIEDIGKIIDNKKAIMNIDKISKEMLNIYNEISLIKSSLDNSLNGLLKSQYVINILNLLNNQDKKINEIVKNLVTDNKKQENLNYLNSVIQYVDNKLGDANPDDMGYQKFVADYSNRLKIFREKYRQIINEKYDFKTVNEIYKKLPSNLKQIETLQQNLLALNEESKNDSYRYLIIILSGLLVLTALFFINNKAELSKRDYDKIKQFESLEKRTKNFKSNLNKIVKIDGVNNIIETGVYLDEDSFRGSRLEEIVGKTNILIKNYESLKVKFDTLNKSTMDFVSPVLSLATSLKKETNNYSLNEINFTNDTLKDVSNLLDTQEIKIDTVNSNIQNISYNLGEASNILETTQDRFGKNRTRMQNSSKQMKKIAEISQKTNDVYEDIRKQVAKIDVISLNLSIEAAQTKNASTNNYAKELKNLSDSIKELTDGMKQKINEIQVNSKDTTDLLERLTNDIVDDGTMLNKTQNILKMLNNSSKSVLESGNSAFIDMNKIKNNIKLLNEKVETLREKDEKKTDVISRSEQAFNKIFETIK